MDQEEQEKQQTQKSLLLSIIIIAAAIILVIILLIVVWSLISSKTTIETPEFKVSPPQTTEKLNFLEELEKDPNFCDTYENIEDIESCKEGVILQRAKDELNISICDEATDSRFIEDCRLEISQLIIEEVAITYHKEDKEGSSEEPSNVQLCDQLEGEDKTWCENPQEVINNNYLSINYKIFKYDSSLAQEDPNAQ